ncbi:putative membrane protein [Ogataea parapolymorpha DL-1]|uniref:Membrane protein n=1 Tax=Ogataea parapolymorpha (strain ATCC 26012 / BCRC 20466 / JCM 22074 / NRRL Y-7560 / DL-1) TaxID=871575 RepID=W1Q813_OGAPD|nr:putative membrane protein [Ogataea parapolymorpha DL-1]ESW96137.1 putative membrane protein [Ogataea parapolymorpha DL-1]
MSVVDGLKYAYGFYYFLFPHYMLTKYESYALHFTNLMLLLVVVYCANLVMTPVFGNLVDSAFKPVLG